METEEDNNRDADTEKKEVKAESPTEAEKADPREHAEQTATAVFAKLEEFNKTGQVLLGENPSPEAESVQRKATEAAVAEAARAVAEIKEAARETETPDIISDPAELRDLKLSMLSKPNEIEAVVPDLTDEEKLKSLGLVKKEDGWHVTNEYFPNPIDENSILINYGKGDMGFCSQAEFSRIYTYKREDGKIEYINPNDLKTGEWSSAVKRATGSFVLLEPGKIVKTNEGNVAVKPGDMVILNEVQTLYGRESSMYIADIGKILQKYVPDTMNPASEEVFEMLKGFLEATKDLKPDDRKREKLFGELVSQFNETARKGKDFTASSKEVKPETLRKEFEEAAHVVDQFEREIGPEINGATFDERVKQAEAIIEKIQNNGNLSPEQKDQRKNYVLVRLLPKTNNHQHLKGSVPKETLLKLAMDHNFTPEQLNGIESAYSEGAEGFESLSAFNKAYGAIAGAVRTPEDYQAAVKGIIEEANVSGQLTVEIRCAVIGQRKADGTPLDPRDATENILQAMDKSCQDLGEEAPKTSLVFLGYRGRDWKPEEVIEHAKLAVEFAKKYPKKKFGFDIAGPEDTGYSPTAFKEGFDLIKEYNSMVDSGQIQGEKIGVTVHAGETPTYDNGKTGSGSIEEALDMGADRIGHGLQAFYNEQTKERLKKQGTTVEICGTCNISSIPINTKGMAVHPVHEFIESEIPVTFCTDNDTVCNTTITAEYARLMMTSSSKKNEMRNWNIIKLAARHGIESSFVSDEDKENALKTFNSRIRTIEDLNVRFNQKNKK